MGRLATLNEQKRRFVKEEKEWHELAVRRDEGPSATIPTPTPSVADASAANAQAASESAVGKLAEAQTSAQTSLGISGRPYLCYGSGMRVVGGKCGRARWTAREPIPPRELSHAPSRRQPCGAHQEFGGNEQGFGGGGGGGDSVVTTEQGGNQSIESTTNTFQSFFFSLSNNRKEKN